MSKTSVYAVQVCECNQHVRNSTSAIERCLPQSYVHHSQHCHRYKTTAVKYTESNCKLVNYYFNSKSNKKQAWCKLAIQ